MTETEPSQFEVHDKDALAHARAIMNATELPRQWAQEVIQAVKRNEEWRGERCINLLAPEAPTSPMVRALLSSEIGTHGGGTHRPCQPLVCRHPVHRRGGGIVC